MLECSRVKKFLCNNSLVRKPIFRHKVLALDHYVIEGEENIKECLN